MKIEQLVKMEGIFILVVIGGLLFMVGKTTFAPTGMAVYDDSEADIMYDRIRAGMSFDKVREILGEPDDVENIEEQGIPVEYWYYSQGRDTLRIGFVNGRVDSKVVT